MKKVTAALALGLLIGSATTAIAATDILQATVSKFKVVVNGQEQQLKNAPIVVNGSSYLPVRETAELLGADVAFENGTITLNRKEVDVVNENPSSQVPINPVPAPSKEYGVGEIIETEHFKLKLNGVSYSTNYRDFVANPGEHFAVVSFDVITSSEPEYKIHWSATDFLDIFTLESGKDLVGLSFTTDKVVQDEWNTVTVSRSIPDHMKIKSVKFADPVKRDGTTYTAKLVNQ